MMTSAFLCVSAFNRHKQRAGFSSTFYPGVAVALCGHRVDLYGSLRTALGGSGRGASFAHVHFVLENKEVSAGGIVTESWRGC